MLIYECKIFPPILVFKGPKEIRTSNKFRKLNQNSSDIESRSPGSAKTYWHSFEARNSKILKNQVGKSGKLESTSTENWLQIPACSEIEVQSPELV